MEETLRVAFFPDTYDEIDGVANTSRQFEAFARKSGFDFLVVCGGRQDRIEKDGSVTRMTCRRGPIGFAVDKNHTFDLAFWRHYSAAREQLRKFRPDVVHITGPSDVGQLGALLAKKMRVPLAASWHTNLHQYAEQRASGFLRLLPAARRGNVGASIRESTLSAILRFYSLADVLFAPNPALTEMLSNGTRKTVYPMLRGVDTKLFAPSRRDRSNPEFTIGYVGRLTVEKNVGFLIDLERALDRAGLANFRFSIVGQGAEEPSLRAQMKKADFHGVLKGEALAQAYANMDAFVFPSRTDTFGNVVLEALASGVPAVVTDSGGPQFIVDEGETGFVARTSGDFLAHVQALASEPQRLQTMRNNARNVALALSWDAIFSRIYDDYRRELRKLSAKQKDVNLSPTASVASRQLS